MPESQTLAERLRDLRVAAGLTHEQAAGRLWHEATVARVERGVHLPGLDLLLHFAEQYGASYELLRALRDAEAGRAAGPMLRGPKDGPRLHCESCGSAAVIDVHGLAVAIRLCTLCGWRKMLRGSMLERDVESVVRGYQLCADAAESARADEERLRKEKGTDESG